jgi:general secretion pathway protein E
MELELEAPATMADTRPAFPNLASDPIDALLSQLVAEALRNRATHLHIESSGSVRLRVAGRLVRTATTLPPETASAIVDRLAGGTLWHAGAEMEASALATRTGTRGVLHLGEAYPGGSALEELGMSRNLARALLRMLDHGGGLVLVAGPARAGKSSTLAALRAVLDDGSRNLLGVDPGDPAPTDALRALLRQDPDAVLIDSVADRHTAAIAIQAAGAGRLVLAGLEAGSAVSAIRRLRDLRVEPFQLASSLRVVLAQRLVRKLCKPCRQPVQAHGSVSALLGFDPGAIVYAPGGCDACHGSGYTGQTAAFEAIIADAALCRLVNDGGDEAIIARHAFLNSPNLGSAARAMVRAGVTTPEEAVRISRG